MSEYFSATADDYRMASVSEIELGPAFHEAKFALESCTHAVLLATVQRVLEFTTNFRRGACTKLLDKKRGMLVDDGPAMPIELGGCITRARGPPLCLRVAFGCRHTPEPEPGARLCDQSSAIQGGLWPNHFDIMEIWFFGVTVN